MLEKILDTGTNIFNPQAQVLANVENVLEFIETGNTAPVLVEFDPSNACNHGCYFCISSYIHLPESKDLETFDRSIMPKDLMLSVKDSELHSFSIPLLVDVNIGENWGELH